MKECNMSRYMMSARMLMGAALLAGLFGVAGPAPTWATGKLYWIETTFITSKIQRANLDGSGVEVLVTPLAYPEGLALDVAGGKMYWTDTGQILRANLDGSGAEFIVGRDGPYSIVVVPGAPT